MLLNLSESVEKLWYVQGWDIIFTEQVGILRKLEQNTGQEIQTFKKAIVKRFEKIEEFIEIDEQGQKVQGQDLASSVHARPWDDLQSFNCISGNFLRKTIWHKVP